MSEDGDRPPSVSAAATQDSCDGMSGEEAARPTWPLVTVPVPSPASGEAATSPPPSSRPANDGGQAHLNAEAGAQSKRKAAAAFKKWLRAHRRKLRAEKKAKEAEEAAVARADREARDLQAQRASQRYEEWKAAKDRARAVEKARRKEEAREEAEKAKAAKEERARGRLSHEQWLAEHGRGRPVEVESGDSRPLLSPWALPRPSYWTSFVAPSPFVVAAVEEQECDDEVDVTTTKKRNGKTPAAVGEELVNPPSPPNLFKNRRPST